MLLRACGLFMQVRRSAMGVGKRRAIDEGPEWESVEAAEGGRRRRQVRRRRE